MPQKQPPASVATSRCCGRVGGGRLPPPASPGEAAAAYCAVALGLEPVDAGRSAARRS